MYVLKVDEEYFLCGDHGYKAISKFEYMHWIKIGKETWSRRELIQVELSKFVFEVLWKCESYRQAYETKVHAFFTNFHIYEDYILMDNIPLKKDKSFDMILPLAQSNFWCSSVVDRAYPFLPPVGFYINKKYETLICELNSIDNFKVLDTAMAKDYYPGRMVDYHNGDYFWIEFKVNGLTWGYDFQNPESSDNLYRYLVILYRKLSDLMISLEKSEEENTIMKNEAFSED